MEQFNLEEYLKNPNRKIITRDGRDARIICTDRRNLIDHPIIALVLNITESAERDYKYDINGKTFDYIDSELDLFFAPIKYEGWINICRNNRECYIYTTEEEAKISAIGLDNYITTIKIEWEE